MPHERGVAAHDGPGGRFDLHGSVESRAVEAEFVCGYERA